MSDDATIEEKQNFLRENILDKNYDVNQFIEFLIDKKGEGGADVSVWSMKDLQIVVKEFIQLNGGDTKENQNEPEISNQDLNQEIKEESKPEKIKEIKKEKKKISMFDIKPKKKN